MAKAAIYAFSAAIAQGVDVFCYPLEMIRVRLMTMNDTYKYRSCSDALIKIVKKDTWRGLYQGGSCYFVNLIGQYSISLTLYEVFMDSRLKKHGSTKFTENETRHVIEASVYSSIVTVLLLNFMEVIVVRRQSGCQDSIKQMF